MARRGIAEVATGAVVLLAAAGFLLFAITHSGRPATSGGYQLRARFDRIDGLIDGADVRIAGVKVGSVVRAVVDPTSFLAVVTLTVSDNIHLPKDTSAEVTSESLLGGKFLNLTPGGATELLKPNDMIAITQSSISLEQLLGKFIFSAANLADHGKGSDSPDTGSPPGPRGPKPNTPAPNGPAANGPAPNGPAPNGPAANGPAPNGDNTGAPK